MSKGVGNRIAWSKVAEASYNTAQVTPANFVSQAYQGDAPVVSYGTEDDKDYITGFVGKLEQEIVTQMLTGNVTYRLQPLIFGVLVRFALGGSFTPAAGSGGDSSSYTHTMTSPEMTGDLPSTTMQVLNARYPTSGSGRQHAGVKIKRLEITGESGKLWNLKVDYFGSGKDESSSMVWTTISNNREDLFSWTDAAIKIATVDKSSKMRKFSFVIENTFAEQDYGAGQAFLSELEFLDRAITGSFTLKEDSTYTTVIDAVKNATDVALQFILTGKLIPSCATATYKIDVTLPRVKLTGSGLSGGKSIQNHEVNYEALVDTSSNKDIGPVVVVNGTASLTS